MLDKQTEKRKQHDRSDYRKPNGLKSQQMAVAFNVGREFKLVAYGDKKNDSTRNSEQEFLSCRLEIAKSFVGKHEQNKCENKAIAVVEPHRSLKSVPDEVERTRDEAEYEKRNQEERSDPLSCGDLIRHKIYGEEHYGKNTAIDVGQTGGSYGVIASRKEFRKEIKEIELCGKIPIGI